MKKNEDLKKDYLYNILKNLSIPEVNNEEHENALWKIIEDEEKLLDKKTNFIDKIKNFFSFKYPVLSYSLVSAFVLIIILSALYFSKTIKSNQSLNIVLANRTDSIKINNKILDNDILSYVLKKNDVIKNSGVSKFSFKLSDSILIDIEKGSELQFLTKLEKNNDGITKFYLIDGSIECNINLPKKSSIFQIKTDLADFTDIGTRFKIKILDNKDVKLEVKEGFVRIENFLKIDKNDSFYKKIKNITEKIIIVKQGQSIVIKKNTIDTINETYKEIKESFSKIKILDKDLINKLNDKLEGIGNNIIKVNFITKYENDKNDINLNVKIEKRSSFNNIKLDEMNIAFSNDKNLIYLANNIDKKIYAFNFSKNKIEWIFEHEGIKKITGIPFVFEDEIIFTTAKTVFILNKNGKLKKVKNLKYGAKYWSSPIIIKNKLFIPVSNDIFIYKENNIQTINYLEQILEQLFITENNNKIYGVELSTRNLFKINLDDNNEKIIISNLKNQSVMPPIVTKNYIFIADNMGYLYKINKNNYDDIRVINLAKNIYASIFYFKNYIYLIANDGYFYKVDAQRFNKFEKIELVDRNPSKDKYLIKKIVKYKNSLIFNNDTGKLFYFDLENNKSAFIEISDSPLISSPIIFNDEIYVFDTKSQLFKVSFK